nr:retrovirus-related Pol polyprotein from transposon TNT 1-94 [Tanacetum cinerariifolium]
MSNTNTNLQAQTSNALYNVIMEAGGKDHPPMLALGSSKTTTEGYMENYKNVSKDIRDQLNAEAEAIRIILIGIDNDIYSTVDACLNACEINRGIAIVNSSTPTYDQEPEMVAKDVALSKEKEIDKLMALISLSFKKIYKPTNNNLRTSSNTSRENQDNTPRINRCTGHVARECKKPKRAKDVAYHKEKMLLCKQKEAGFQLNVEQADWRDDINDEPEDQELEAHYITGIRYAKPYTLRGHPPRSPALVLSLIPSHFCNYKEMEKASGMAKALGDTNITIDSLDMCNNGETDDQDDDDLAKERYLLASLIEKLKCKIDDIKNHLNKFQVELDRYHDVNYASKVEIDCAKAKRNLMSYKIESEKSSNEYTRKINDLSQTISDMKKELFAHQETIFIMSQEKEAQIKFYKTREDKEIDKVIDLENKVKVLDNIVYKTEIILFIVDSGCSKHMTKNLKLLSNFVENFLGMMKFGNNQIALILGYGDLVQGNITIKRFYYVEGLNHNLFSFGQFCDTDLEVAFRKSTCYIRDLKGNDLLTGSHGTDLYSITLQDTSTPNLICLMAKALSSQAWLWHRRLSHLNFYTINLLSKYDVVTRLPKLKFIKDHLCYSCELRKAKRKSFHTNTNPSSKRRLQLLHMDLCGPMRVESINGKKYVLVIVDDYSRYTWTHVLRSKDKTPEVLIDFLRLV